jgi:Holliday junction resolvase
VSPEEKSRLSRRSRGRGKRAEYGLRNYLRSLGWQADRVPSSGASQGFPGDVRAVKGDRTLLFECKCYTEKFDQFWVLLDTYQRTEKNDLLSVAVPGSALLCCDISYSLEALFDSDGVYTLTYRQPLYAQFKSTFDRLETMQKMVKGSDVLVLKSDRKPWIFLRYR